MRFEKAEANIKKTRNMEENIVIDASVYFYWHSLPWWARHWPFKSYFIRQFIEQNELQKYAFSE